MKRLLLIAAMLGPFGGHASADYQPPTIPYSETGISCSIVIPMLAVD